MWQKRKLNSCGSSVLCVCCKVSSSCWIIPVVSCICSKCSFRFVLFCSFHLQLFHPKLSNMRAVLCCSSEVCFFKRRAPPSRLNISSILGSFMVWVTPPVSWNGREWISWRCSASSWRASEGNWITARSFCTNHRPPRSPVLWLWRSPTSNFFSFFFFGRSIKHQMMKAALKGVHTFGRSTGFSRPPASKYFIASVKSKAVRAGSYRLLVSREMEKDWKCFSASFCLYGATASAETTAVEPAFPFLAVTFFWRRKSHAKQTSVKVWVCLGCCCGTLVC